MSHIMTKPTKWRALSEDSDQPGHPPSLIRVFAVCLMGSYGPKLSSCGQWRLWSDWADVQADLSLRWVHMPVYWFCHEAAHIWLGKGGTYLYRTFPVFYMFDSKNNFTGKMNLNLINIDLWLQVSQKVFFVFQEMSFEAVAWANCCRKWPRSFLVLSHSMQFCVSW